MREGETAGIANSHRNWMLSNIAFPASSALPSVIAASSSVLKSGYARAMYTICIAASCGEGLITLNFEPGYMRCHIRAHIVFANPFQIILVACLKECQYARLQLRYFLRALPPPLLSYIIWDMHVDGMFFEVHV